MKPIRQRSITVPYSIDTDCNEFPPAHHALADPDGLLAMGGNLSSESLVNAYSQGIFPWFEEGQPILWWSPNPRMVLYPSELKISRSLKKTINKNIFKITSDTAFETVVNACSAPREGSTGTWITQPMKKAYLALFNKGLSHSFEAWHDDRLVGGLYGVALGRVFFGESMFHTKTDASKVAFAFCVNQLQEMGFNLIDCQLSSHYLKSFGGKNISRTQFLNHLGTWCSPETKHIDRS